VNEEVKIKEVVVNGGKQKQTTKKNINKLVSNKG